jgi:hypothetical protein
MYCTCIYLDRIQFLVFASQVVEDTHPNIRQQNWIFSTYDTIYGNLQLPDTIPTAVHYVSWRHQQKESNYVGLDCRSFQAWAEYFSICEPVQTCCVWPTIFTFQCKKAVLSQGQNGQSMNSSASSTQVTSAWDNSHVHFSIHSLTNFFCRTSRRSPYIRRQWSHCVLIHQYSEVAGSNMTQT